VTDAGKHRWASERERSPHPKAVVDLAPPDALRAHTQPAVAAQDPSRRLCSAWPHRLHSHRPALLHCRRPGGPHDCVAHRAAGHPGHLDGGVLRHRCACVHRSGCARWRRGGPICRTHRGGRPSLQPRRRAGCLGLGGRWPRRRRFVSQLQDQLLAQCGLTLAPLQSRLGLSKLVTDLRRRPSCTVCPLAVLCSRLPSGDTFPFPRVSQRQRIACGWVVAAAVSRFRYGVLWEQLG
jgi:hypothetical protein